MADVRRLTKVEKCSVCQDFEWIRFAQIANQYYVECSECQNHGKLAATKHEAVAKWNDGQKGKVEKLHVH